MNTLESHELHREFSAKIENISMKLLVDAATHKISSQEYKDLYNIMHDHATSELFVCGDGEISIQFHNGIVRLGQGEAAIIPKGLRHTKCPDTRDAEWYAISFLCTKISSSSEHDLYRELSAVTDLDKVVIFKNASDIFERVKKIIELSKCRFSLLPVMHMTELLLILGELDREFFDGSKGEDENDSADSDNDLKRIAKLDRLIYNGYMRNITVEEIASELFISSRQLDRIARKRYGKPIHRVIMERRISAAEKMLAESSMTVDRIGSTVGFGSRSGFYREFKRKHGITPNEYRQQNKN